MYRLAVSLGLALQFMLLPSWTFADKLSIEQIVLLEAAAARLDIRADIMRLETIAVCPDSSRAAVDLARRITTELQQVTEEKRPVITAWLEAKAKLPPGSLPDSKDRNAPEPSGKWWQRVAETLVSLYIIDRLR